MKIAAGAVLLLLAAACSVRPQYPNYSNVREDLVVRMPEKDVQPFIVALRKNATTGAGVNLNVNAWLGSGEPSVANADAYDAAMDDARHKAARIAGRMNVRLGAIQSVVEFQGPNRANDTPLRGRVEAMVIVHDNGPIALGVTYATSTGGSVSVFGLSDVAAHGAPQGVDVNLSSNASSSDVAWAHVNQVERIVRDTARRFGVRPEAITIQNTGFES
ncbi:MAG TPA: SIMPL domain-containing protein [Candidatus Rubrimentiphilum sp.]|nr:SIMPL domain-containing protein [Candidatus Rubrimentiphilum sp.]